MIWNKPSTRSRIASKIAVSASIAASGALLGLLLGNLGMGVASQHMGALPGIIVEWGIPIVMYLTIYFSREIYLKNNRKWDNKERNSVEENLFYKYLWFAMYMAIFVFLRYALYFVSGLTTPSSIINVIVLIAFGFWGFGWFKSNFHLGMTSQSSS